MTPLRRSWYRWGTVKQALPKDATRPMLLAPIMVICPFLSAGKPYSGRQNSLSQTGSRGEILWHFWTKQ
jgi:hypothetical protein